MATFDYSSADNAGNLAYSWGPLSLGDDGKPSIHAGSGDRTVQVLGTFGNGGTCLIEGSLDGVNFSPLHDAQGNALSFSAAGIKAVQEHVLAIRPRIVAGDVSTALTVIINVRR